MIWLFFTFLYRSLNDVQFVQLTTFHSFQVQKGPKKIGPSALGKILGNILSNILDNVLGHILGNTLSNVQGNIIGNVCA